jgi:hypothetical protein
MPYDDDDDLFGEEFDFVDEDDDASEGEAKKEEAKEKPAPKPKRRTPARDKAPAERPKPRGRGAGAAGTGGTARRSSRANEEPAAPVPPPLKSPERLYADDADDMDEDDDAPAEVDHVKGTAPVEESVPDPVGIGPPADHVVHIYEHGKLKRTIPRKFTDEEAVNFAEEYTRTGKNYGRYAVATPEDEEPADTFAGASRGG